MIQLSNTSSGVNGNLFEKVICPNCLKTIIIRELQFICPYCDKVHGEVKSKSDNPLINIFSTFAEMIDDFGKSKILYEACYCGGEIRYLNCPYCHNDIDLFAPYDYQELKSQRTR